MASHFKIIYMPLAQNCAYDLHNFIFSQSKDLKTADRVLRRIVAYIDNLTFNPFMGRILSEYKFKTKDVRRITAEKRYNIYYHVDEQLQIVYILKIVDGKQSIKRQLHGL